MKKEICKPKDLFRVCRISCNTCPPHLTRPASKASPAGQAGATKSHKPIADDGRHVAETVRLTIPLLVINTVACPASCLLHPQAAAPCTHPSLPVAHHQAVTWRQAKAVAMQTDHVLFLLPRCHSPTATAAITSSSAMLVRCEAGLGLANGCRSTDNRSACSTGGKANNLAFRASAVSSRLFVR